MKKKYIVVISAFVLSQWSLWGYAAASSKNDNANVLSLTDIVTSGVMASKKRQKIAAENIAHANTTASKAGEDPYRRKIPVFKEEINKENGDHLINSDTVVEDQSEFIYKYDPSHPAAFQEGPKKGYVAYPNVNLVVEKADFTQAGISYKALIELAKEDKRNTLDLLSLIDQ